MKKEESMLTVLMYLFKHHLQEGIELDGELFDELESAGFPKLAIHNAIRWLERLTLKDDASKGAQTHRSTRILTTQEKSRLSIDCQNYIIYLQEHILDPISTEMMLDQLFALADEGIDISLIQWVSLMVLYNKTDHEEALKKMEFLVLNEREQALQ